jgi:hypothetical protein
MEVREPLDPLGPVGVFPEDPGKVMVHIGED